MNNTNNTNNTNSVRYRFKNGQESIFQDDPLNGEVGIEIKSKPPIKYTVKRGNIAAIERTAVQVRYAERIRLVQKTVKPIAQRSCMSWGKAAVGFALLSVGMYICKQLTDHCRMVAGRELCTIMYSYPIVTPGVLALICLMMALSQVAFSGDESQVADEVENNKDNFQYQSVPLLPNEELLREYADEFINPNYSNQGYELIDSSSGEDTESDEEDTENVSGFTTINGTKNLISFDEVDNGEGVGFFFGANLPNISNNDDRKNDKEEKPYSARNIALQGLDKNEENKLDDESSKKSFFSDFGIPSISNANTIRTTLKASISSEKQMQPLTNEKEVNEFIENLEKYPKDNGFANGQQVEQALQNQADKSGLEIHDEE